MTNEFNKFDAEEMLVSAAEYLLNTEGYDETLNESVAILNNAKATMWDCLHETIEFDREWEFNDGEFDRINHGPFEHPVQDKDGKWL